MVTLYAKWGAGRGSMLRLLVAVALLVGWGSSANAQTVKADTASSDLPAGYIVLPKIVVHTTGSLSQPLAAGDVATDTLIQLTNTNAHEAINVHCYYVNANSHCGGTSDGGICTLNSDCPLGQSCVQLWQPTNFTVTLTPSQPIGFTAAGGLRPVPCDPLFPGPGCTGQAAGFIPPVADPFIGELKCVETDANDTPLPQNDLKAEATVITTLVPTTTPPSPPGITTAASYNAIGFQADETFPVPTNATSADPLCLGALPPGSGSLICRQDYAPCPGVLIVNHFFDGATTEVGGVVDTELTLVPCSEDLTNAQRQSAFQVTAQMLIYNEFEQRFSSGAKINCYRATRLSDIDTGLGPSGDSFSIFSVGVQGTEVGQTRIRGVTGAPTGLGFGLIGVACENYHATSLSDPVLSRTAFNLHEDGFRAEGDAVFVNP
jgi:hypothetical protein